MTRHAARRLVAIDLAGSAEGGARRFRNELFETVNLDRPDSPRVLGLKCNLSPRYLVQREFEARSMEHVIAANNASFALAGQVRTVLLRNALHFASAEEVEQVGDTKTIRSQIPIIRGLARRADRIVVPCSAMADRVSQYCPSLASRIDVRFHPVGPPSWTSTAPTYPNSVLLPSLPAPYKRLAERTHEFLEATEGTEIILRVTAMPGELGSVEHHPRVNLLGRLTPEELSTEWAGCGAIYFPTLIESFGYPLAEARAGGRHVIAADTAQNKEIAGRALCSYQSGSTLSLRDAVRFALHSVPSPDPEPFDPEMYFNDLLDWAT